MTIGTARRFRCGSGILPLVPVAERREVGFEITQLEKVAGSRFHFLSTAHGPGTGPRYDGSTACLPPPAALKDAKCAKRLRLARITARPGNESARRRAASP